MGHSIRYNALYLIKAGAEGLLMLELKMQSTILHIFWIFQLCCAAGPGMIRQDLPSSSYPLAVCNDGTQANYYHQPGESHGKILIGLQGGGTCDSIENCNDRCDKTDLCTAQTDQELDIQLPFGGQGDDPFHDYWHVQVHYCSSDTWSGTKKASDETGGYNFYGKHIFEAVVQDLAENFNLLEATNIVLTGSSAGAQGAIFRCDDFSEWILSQNPSIDVRCMPDAPEFFPPDVHTEDCRTRDPGYQNYLTEFWGRVEDKSCMEYAEANGVENVGELCGLTANFAQFVTTPLLILSSHEDSSFAHIFGCEPRPGTPEHDEFRTDWMAAHSELVMELMADFPEIAFFAPNCRIHGVGGHREIMVTEDESGEKVNVRTFISHWLSGDGHQPIHANDDVTVDNPTCETV